MLLDSPLILISAVVALAGLAELSRYVWFLYQRTLSDSYFVRWLTNEQKQALKHANIPFTAQVFDAEGDGVLLARKDFKKALRVLKANVVEYVIIRLNQVHEAVLTFTPEDEKELRQFGVYFDSKKVGSRRTLQRVVHDVLMPSLKRDIVIHTTRGAVESPPDDDCFHLYLYAAPERTGKQKAPERLMGVPVKNRGETLAPTGRGIPVIDTATNFVLAEIVGDSVYICLDIIQDRKRSQQRGLLARVLQKVEEELLAERFLTEIISNANRDGKFDRDDAELDGFDVTSNGFDARRQQVISMLVRDILLPVVKRNVIVKNMQGANAFPAEDGSFRIYFNSSPQGSASLSVPDRLWGVRLLKKGNAFPPSALGLPLVDDSGFVLGELVDNNLYFHQEYMLYGCQMEAALLARLLIQVRDEIALGGSGPEKIHERVGSLFIAECLRQVSASGAANARVTSQDALKAQGEFRELLKATRLEETNLIRLQAAPAEELGREYDELLKLANVIEVQVTKDVIKVTTDTIYCRNPKTGKRHDIGAFEIQISTSANWVKWYNKTRKVNGGRNGMNAPHVDENGNACYGNTKDLFPMLIGKREFATVVQLAIAFVEAVNLDDNWGKFIGNWPTAD